MSRICVDTGFLLALYARKDDPTNKAKALRNLALFGNRANKIVLAWPVMYETLRTRVTEHKAGVELFERHLRQFRRDDQLIQIDDRTYRENAFAECFSELKRGTAYRGLSLVDRIVRHVIGDAALRISGLITFNTQDFVDVCRARRIQMYN